MSQDTREVVISYGSFDSNDTGWQLTGVHSWDMDERTFRCSYDVVYLGGSASAVESAEQAMIQQLEGRHRAFKIVVDSVTYFHFVDGVDGAASGQEGAEYIQASWQILGTHRTKFSRAYRITVTVTRAANQSGKPGILEQSIRLTTLPNSVRRLVYRAQFTPGPTDSETGSAEARFADATYGFDARVTAIQTALGGTWERTGTLSKVYDEDSRSLVASASYTELIYDQSASGTNDAKLVGVSYDVSVTEGSAYSVPGYGGGAAPFSTCTVSFRSTVDKAETQDLNDVIRNTVLPYVRSTVVNALELEATPQELSNTLRADPVDNRISGEVLFLIEPSTTNTLEASLRTVDAANNGIRLVPVLDGQRWTRDRHTGPGSWTRRVVIGVRVLGLNASSVLDSIEQDQRNQQEAAGFVFTGWGVATSPSRETKVAAGAGAGFYDTTVETRTLVFERADIRPAGNPGGGAAGLSSGLSEDSERGGLRERF